jgi:hypothetical protein
LDAVGIGELEGDKVNAFPRQRIRGVHMAEVWPAPCNDLISPADQTWY